MTGESIPADRETAPEPHWQRTVWALWLAQTLALVAFSMRAPFIPFYLADLGADARGQAYWASLIAAGGALTSILATPFWGRLADRVGRKPMVVRALVFGALILGLMSLATAPWQLFGLRLVEGATTGTVAAVAALVAATVPKARVGFALGLMQTSVFTGGAIGPLIGSLIADGLGYRATYAACGVMLAVAAVLAFALVRERFERPAPAGPRRGTLAPRVSWLVPSVVAMLGAMLVVRAASQAMQPILPLFVERLPDIGMSAARASGLVFGAQGVAAAVTSLGLGALGDRVGHRRVLVGSAIGAGLAYLPMGLVESTWQLIGLQFLFGLCAGGMIPSVSAILSAATAGRDRGAVFGLLASAGSVGTLLGPLAGATIAHGAGYGWAFAVVGVALLATGLAVPTLTRAKAAR